MHLLLYLFINFWITCFIIYMWFSYFIYLYLNYVVLSQRSHSGLLLMSLPVTNCPSGAWTQTWINPLRTRFWSFIRPFLASRRVAPCWALNSLKFFTFQPLKLHQSLMLSMKKIFCIKKRVSILLLKVTCRYCWAETDRKSLKKFEMYCGSKCTGASECKQTKWKSKQMLD